LIVGLGYDTVEVEYEAWIGDRPLLQIDIEPVDVASSVNLVHQVSGDFDVSLARLLTLPPAVNQWNAATLAEHRRGFHAALRPGRQVVHGACRDRRGTPRIAARGAARVRRRRAYASDREPMERPCAQDVPHHQWLVVHGLRSAGRDRGQARAPGGAGGLPAGG